MGRVGQSTYAGCSIGIARIYITEVLRLERDVFVNLVNIFIERDYLTECCFLKAFEIVAMSLFILARGASYQEAEDRFQHSPSI